MRCAICNTKNEDDAIFCQVCRSPLSSGKNPQVQAPEPQHDPARQPGQISQAPQQVTPIPETPAHQLQYAQPQPATVAAAPEIPSHLLNYIPAQSGQGAAPETPAHPLQYTQVQPEPAAVSSGIPPHLLNYTQAQPDQGAAFEAPANPPQYAQAQPEPAVVSSGIHSQLLNYTQAQPGQGATPETPAHLLQYTQAQPAQSAAAPEIPQHLLNYAQAQQEPSPVMPESGQYSPPPSPGPIQPQQTNPPQAPYISVAPAAQGTSRKKSTGNLMYNEETVGNFLTYSSKILIIITRVVCLILVLLNAAALVGFIALKSELAWMPDIGNIGIILTISGIVFFALAGVFAPLAFSRRYALGVMVNDIKTIRDSAANKDER